MDDAHAIIVDVEGAEDQETVRWAVSPTNLARLSQEIVAAKAMLARSGEAVGVRPDSLAADKSYDTAPFLAWLLERHVTPYIPILDRKGQTDGKFTRDRFRYDPNRDRFLCPEEQELTLRGVTAATGVKRYKAKAGACRGCPLKPRCTDSASRTVIRLVDEDARETVRALADTEAFVTARARRKKVEMLFAHLKRHLNLRRLRLRGLSGATEEFLLAATAQNLKRLARLRLAQGLDLDRRASSRSRPRMSSGPMARGPKTYILGAAFSTDIDRFPSAPILNSPLVLCTRMPPAT